MEVKYSLIKRAVYIGSFRILLEFEDGSNKILDCNPWLKEELGSFNTLKQEDNFTRFYIESGILTWENGYDVSPEYAYNESLPVIVEKGKADFKLIQIGK